MKRLLLLAVFLLLAQNARATAVSATVTDAGAQAWAGGSYAFVWVPAPGFSGTPPAIPAPGLLDGSGAFTSVTVTASTSIFPSGSKWIVRVCPIASASCYSTAPLTITGTTQNITAFITPPAISVSTSTGNQPVAYADAEITSPIEGFVYLNYTSGNLRKYHSGSFADVGGGAATSVPFSGITNGSNTTAAMHVGTGASLDATGSGTIHATTSDTATSATTATTAATTTGNAATATALAATPTLCSTGQAPTGILASGNATGCAAGTTPTGTPVVTPFPITTSITGTNTNTATATFYCRAQGSQLNFFPTTWKMKMNFLQGSPVIGNMVVKRTLTNSTTVVDTTSILVGGVSNPTLSSPSLVASDTVSLATDATHDYYLEVFFTSAAANVTTAINWTGAAGVSYSPLACGFAASDITGSSTAPSTFAAATQFLFTGIFVQ